MESEQAGQSVEQSQYLTFFIADEEYAVSIVRVKEIIQYDTLTKVPKTPHWIRGVINLRGGVVPVVDLAVKFGLPETAITSWSDVVAGPKIVGTSLREVVIQSQEGIARRCVPLGKPLPGPASSRRPSATRQACLW